MQDFIWTDIFMANELENYYFILQSLLSIWDWSFLILCIYNWKIRKSPQEIHSIHPTLSRGKQNFAEINEFPCFWKFNFVIWSTYNFMVNNAVNNHVSRRPLTCTFTNINSIHNVKMGRQNKTLACKNAFGFFPKTCNTCVIMRKPSDKPKLRTTKYLTRKPQGWWGHQKQGKSEKLS